MKRSFLHPWMLFKVEPAITFYAMGIECWKHPQFPFKCHNLVIPVALYFNFPVRALRQNGMSGPAGWNPAALESGSSS